MSDARSAPRVPSRAELPFFPDFFLVGAPRCGTTSLARHLSQHPQVCFSRPKEPHFFNKADDAQLADLRRRYLEACFPHRDPARHRVVGEGSVSYLYDERALERILAIHPEARFLVAVRSPIEMLRSYHYRMLYVLEEDEEDFARAWALQEPRARGECLPRRCLEPRLLQYAQVGRLGHWVERLLARTGRERVMVVVQEDMCDRPRELNAELCAFVGVDDDGRDRFPRRFKSKSYRHRWIHELLFKPPAPVRRAVQRRERSGRRAAPSLTRARKRLLYWNRADRPAPPLDPSLRGTLRDAFAADVERLGRVLGRDLGHWLA